MNVIAIDLPLNSIKAPDISGYFNGLLSKKRNEIIEERLIKKYNLVMPTGGTYTLGLLSIASSLKAYGHAVQYVVLDHYSEEVIDSVTAWSDVQVALFSCKTTTYPLALEIAKVIKKHNPGIVTVFGGPHCNALPLEVIRNPQVDFVSVGEGEFTTAQLLEALQNTSDLDRIPGLYYKDMDGEVVENRANDLISSIDSIPEIDYGLLPGTLRDYHIYVETTRGCQYQCSFCANPLFWKRKVRCYNVKRTYDRLAKISEELAPNTLVHLVDPSYGNSQTIEELCELLKENPLPLKFSCDINALHVEEEKVKRMYEAGVRMFCLGIESFDEEVLRYNKKPQTTEMVYRACQIIRNITDAFIKTYWIVGLPGENEDSCKVSRDAAVRMLSEKLTDVVCEHVFVPYPGCDVFEHPAEYNFSIIHRDWGNYDARSFPLPGESLSFSMERVFIAYLDFLRAQCEFYNISDRYSLLGMSNEYDFRTYKGSLV